MIFLSISAQTGRHKDQKNVDWIEWVLQERNVFQLLNEYLLDNIFFIFVLLYTVAVA